MERIAGRASFGSASGFCGDLGQHQHLVDPQSRLLSDVRSWSRSRMPVMQFGSSQMSHLGQVRLRGTLHLKADYFLSETEFNYIYV